MGGNNKGGSYLQRHFETIRLDGDKAQHRADPQNNPTEFSSLQKDHLQRDEQDNVGSNLLHLALLNLQEGAGESCRGGVPDIR